MVSDCGIDRTGPDAITVKFGRISAKTASGITTERNARAPGRL